MPSVSITTLLSDEDLEAIVNGVFERIKPLLDSKPALVSAEEMALIAGVSPATLERLRRSGKIPSCKAGNRRLYNPPRVIEAMEAES